MNPGVRPVDKDGSWYGTAHTASYTAHTAGYKVMCGARTRCG